MTRIPAPTPRKTSRRRSREFAMQGLYQWQLAGTDAATIESQMAVAKGFDKTDRAYFSSLLAGAIREAQRLEQSLQPYLDRKCAELSPVERAILFIAAYELENQPDIPYRVVINEAVELAKGYEDQETVSFINGILGSFMRGERGTDVLPEREPDFSEASESMSAEEN